MENRNLKHLSDQIKTKAKELGFYSCGISKATFLSDDAKRLTKWLQEGKHAEMQYMENHFEKRTDPQSVKLQRSKYHQGGWIIRRSSEHEILREAPWV